MTFTAKDLAEARRVRVDTDSTSVQDETVRLKVVDPKGETVSNEVVTDDTSAHFIKESDDATEKKAPVRRSRSRVVKSESDSE